MKNELNKEKTACLGVKLEEGEPALYSVLLHHDEFTAREFVVGVLERFFNMDRRRAVELMQIAQQQGRAVCGLFTRDVAATKIREVLDHATSEEFPLVCSMEAA